MSPLIDVLETVPGSEIREIPGRYDHRRGLRVDEGAHPIVDFARVAETGTETRGGRDQDESSSDVAWLETLTEQDGRDHDEPLALQLTKTAGGRDTDDDRMVSVLLGSVTFAGPDRD